MEIIYSENSTNKLFISNNHPKGPPYWYLARIEVDWGRHKVLVEEVLRKVLLRMLFHSESIILHPYYTFQNYHLANLCSLDAPGPVQLVAEELLGEQAASADVLQWNAFHLIENIFIKYKRETKLWTRFKHSATSVSWPHIRHVRMFATLRPRLRSRAWPHFSQRTRSRSSDKQSRTMIIRKKADWKSICKDL